MSSTLHGHKTPRGQKAPELEQAAQAPPLPPLFFFPGSFVVSHQALAVERGIWDSKEGMAINAEVSRACLGLP